MEHDRVVAQGRAGVDHREDRGLVVDGGFVDATGDPDHLDGVLVALPAEAVHERELVGQRQHVVGGVEVPDGGVEVHGFDRVAGHGVDGVEDLAHLDEVPVVLTIAVAAVAAEARHERGAGDRRVDDVVAAEDEVAYRVPAVEGELRWSGRDQVGDEFGVEADPVAVDVGAGLGQLPTGGVIEEVDAGLA